MNPLLLIGSGGHCHACIDVIESERKHHIAGIVSPSRGENKDVMGYTIVGDDEDLPLLLKQIPNVLVTVGQIKSPNVRVRLFELLKSHGANFPVVKSPSSYLSNHASIGEGAILMHSCMVNARVEVGANCIINSQALIEHDVKIADHCHISTGAKLNGSVRIGRGTFVGSGSIIKQGINVGAQVVIGAGQLILEDIPDKMIIKAKNV